LQLALERGLENLTIEAISAAAGVPSGAFSSYFASREEAIAGDGPVMPQPQTLREFVGGGPTSTLLLDLRRVLQHNVDQVSGRWAEMRARRELLERYPALMPRLMVRFDALEDELARAVAERIGVDPRLDPRPRLTAAVAVTALRVAFKRWTEQDETRSFTDHLDEVFAPLEQGL
jgi:AcrR family transcriptional regulator